MNWLGKLSVWLRSNRGQHQLKADSWHNSYGMAEICVYVYFSHWEWYIFLASSHLYIPLKIAFKQHTGKTEEIFSQYAKLCSQGPLWLSCDVFLRYANMTFLLCDCTWSPALSPALFLSDIMRWGIICSAVKTLQQIAASVWSSLTEFYCHCLLFSFGQAPDFPFS